MHYCSKCSCLTQEEICPKCKRKVPEIAPNEPVLLSGMDTFTASLLEPLLSDAGIPYSRMGQTGTAFAVSGGLTLEEIRIYVPYGAYEQARELWEMLSSAESVQ